MPAQPDQVLDAHLAAESDPNRAGSDARPDPYWAELWSSAIPTAESVMRADWRGDETALELGCGVGLVGLAALERGLPVTFSDQVMEAVRTAQENARRNGFPCAAGMRLDWRDPMVALGDRRFQVVLASDVLYHLPHHAALLDTIDQALAPDGVCWIGDPGRYHVRSFISAASERFQVRLCDLEGEDFAVPLAGALQLLILRR